MTDKELTYEEILSKVTDPKQQAFLENYHKFGQITSTAKAIGIDRTTVWNWRQVEGNPFLDAFNCVKKEYDADLLLRHERNIDDIAFDKEQPAQSRVLASIFVTKALDPKRYREKTDAIPFTGDITIHLAVPRPGDNQVLEPKQLKEGKDAIQGPGEEDRGGSET